MDSGKARPDLLTKRHDMKFCECSESRKRIRNRTAVASLDLVLVLGIILPLAAFLFYLLPRMIKLVYEMTITLIGSPLM